MDVDPKTRATSSMAEIAPSIAAVMDQGPPSPRRFTISTFPAISPRTRRNGGNGQCTHITTTRLYTEDFRCTQCLNLGSFGWLYRCTQDRELLLEEDIERGCEEKLDEFHDLMPKSISPRKRSPSARLDKLSFLTEISDEAMKHYTPEQLKTVLVQRAHLLDTVSQPDLKEFPESFFSNRPLPTPYQNPPPGLPVPAGCATDNTGLKPWFPFQGGECQFKCCHFCRPSMKDRSYLSLNGIANGDIPATSITGFGFHLQKKRPIALVEHVKNLGLRPNPPHRLPPHPDDSEDTLSLPPSPTISPKRRKKIKRRPACLGLGIVSTEAAHPSASPSITSPIPQSSIQSSTPTFANFPPFPSNPMSPVCGPGVGINLSSPAISNLSSFERETLSSLPSSEVPNRRHTYSPWPSTSESAKRIHTLATVTPLPPPTPTEQSFNMPSNIATASYNHGLRRRPTGHIAEIVGGTGIESAHEREGCNFSFEADMDIDVDANAENGIIASRPLTAMETGELIQGEFGRAPLEVKNGVAITEEGVELHVPDIITQF